MDLDRLELPLRTLPLNSDSFVRSLDFRPDVVSRAGQPVSRPRKRFRPQTKPGVTGPVVVVPLLDGRWMVLRGEAAVAAALEAGGSSIEVQVIPINEALAGIGDRRKTFYPGRRYRKNLKLLDRIGEPEANLNPDLVALADQIKRDPLVRMGDIYQPLPFPEFRALSPQADDRATYTRLGMILNVLGNPADKKVLDLGCNVGFFLFSLALRGCRTSGLDLEPRFVDVGQRVAAAKGLDAEFVAAPLEPGAFGPGGALAGLADHPVNDSSGEPWDLITCFSMLQWVEKQHDLDYCRRILGEIHHHARALLVDIPVNCSGVYMKSPVGKERFWLERLLKESCGFHDYVYMGKVAPYRVDWRHVFYCHN